MRSDLAPLLRHPGLRSAAVARPRTAGIATGDHRLDALLHWQGWPRGNLTELLASPGHGEFTLVVPALARLVTGGGWIFLIDPPHLPHAQALRQLELPGDRLLVVRCSAAGDPLWAGEQILRSGICAALLLWEGARLWRPTQLRRLQGRARTAGGSVFLYRRVQALREPSPAPLRIALTGAAGALRLTIHKQPGGSGQHLVIGQAPPAAPLAPWPLPVSPLLRQPLAGGRHRQPGPPRSDHPLRAAH